MRLRTLLLTSAMATLTISSTAQTAVAHFDMSLGSDGKITEQVTGASYDVASQLPACSIEGIDGEALRFDGYSNYVKAGLPVGTLSTETLTLSVILK